VRLGLRARGSWLQTESVDDELAKGTTTPGTMLAEGPPGPPRVARRAAHGSSPVVQDDTYTRIFLRTHSPRPLIVLYPSWSPQSDRSAQRSLARQCLRLRGCGRRSPPVRCRVLHLLASPDLCSVTPLRRCIAFPFSAPFLPLLFHLRLIIDETASASPTDSGHKTRRVCSPRPLDSDVLSHGLGYYVRGNQIDDSNGGSLSRAGVLSWVSISGDVGRSSSALARKRRARHLLSTGRTSAPWRDS